MRQIFPKASDQVGARDHLIGALLGSSYLVWLLATARSLGFARDEGFYFRAATDYSRWFRLLMEKPSEAFTQRAIDSVWATNHEHPSLMKSLFAFSWMAFHEGVKVFDDASTAFRFPGMVMAAVALYLTYLFGARVYGRLAGGVAAVLFALMPRVFYHSHLACFDIGIVAMWLVSIYAYYRAGQAHKWGRYLVAGLLYGLTLETKHNAWYLPVVFVVHALVCDGLALLRTRKARSVSFALSLVPMALLGPLVFYALWPWMWNDTQARVQEYFAFHMHHDYYNMEFLGKNYFSPPSPRLYMPVMIATTVPAVTLALFFVGLASRFVVGLPYMRDCFVAWKTKTSLAEEGEKAPGAGRTFDADVLFLLAIGVALGPFVLPETPIFGGTKHWMPAYPFLALFAGKGFVVAYESVRALCRDVAAKYERWVLPALLVTVVAAPLAITEHSHPFGLTSYTPFVGGAAGAADIGLNRQFWGFTTESANTEYLQANASRGARIFFHDTAWDSWQRMQAEGRVRADFRGVGSPSESDYALVQHELHMAEVDYAIWMAFGTVAPVYVVTHDDVPVVSIYKRP